MHTLKSGLIRAVNQYQEEVNFKPNNRRQLDIDNISHLIENMQYEAVLYHKVQDYLKTMYVGTTKRSRLKNYIRQVLAVFPITSEVENYYEREMSELIKKRVQGEYLTNAAGWENGQNAMVQELNEKLERAISSHDKLLIENDNLRTTAIELTKIVEEMDTSNYALRDNLAAKDAELEEMSEAYTELSDNVDKLIQQNGLLIKKIQEMKRQPLADRKHTASQTKNEEPIQRSTPHAKAVRVHSAMFGFKDHGEREADQIIEDSDFSDSHSTSSQSDMSEDQVEQSASPISAR